MNTVKNLRLPYKVQGGNLLASGEGLGSVKTADVQRVLITQTYR
jgi:hypothetical protein